MDINVNDLKERLDAGTAPKIIDVREPWEFEKDHIAAENIPMGEVPGRLDELEQYKDQELIVCCRSGGRSGNIANFLRSSGFNNVRNLTGGMLAWKTYIDPAFRVE